jgi:hypothetical protein
MPVMYVLPAKARSCPVVPCMTSPLVCVLYFIDSLTRRQKSVYSEGPSDAESEEEEVAAGGIQADVDVEKDEDGVEKSIGISEGELTLDANSEIKPLLQPGETISRILDCHRVQVRLKKHYDLM